jgi:hypothetical protein
MAVAQWGGDEDNKLGKIGASTASKDDFKGFTYHGVHEAGPLTVNSWYCRKKTWSNTSMITVKKRKSPKGPGTCSECSVFIVTDIVKLHVHRTRLTERPFDTAPKNKPYCIDW